MKWVVAALSLAVLLSSGCTAAIDANKVASSAMGQLDHDLAADGTLKSVHLTAEVKASNLGDIKIDGRATFYKGDAFEVKVGFPSVSVAGVLQQFQTQADALSAVSMDILCTPTRIVVVSTGMSGMDPSQPDVNAEGPNQAGTCRPDSKDLMQKFGDSMDAIMGSSSSGGNDVPPPASLVPPFTLVTAKADGNVVTATYKLDVEKLLDNFNVPAASRDPAVMGKVEEALRNVTFTATIADNHLTHLKMVSDIPVTPSADMPITLNFHASFDATLSYGTRAAVPDLHGATSVDAK